MEYFPASHVWLQEDNSLGDFCEGHFQRVFGEFLWSPTEDWRLEGLSLCMRSAIPKLNAGHNFKMNSQFGGSKNFLTWCWMLPGYKIHRLCVPMCNSWGPLQEVLILLQNKTIVPRARASRLLTKWVGNIIIYQRRSEPKMVESDKVWFIANRYFSLPLSTYIHCYRLFAEAGCGSRFSTFPICSQPLMIFMHGWSWKAGMTTTALLSFHIWLCRLYMLIDY